MKNMYTLYDLVANEITGSIMTIANDAPAIRSFHDALSHKDSPISSHPADYNLINIGQIDQFGHIKADEPLTVATGKAWLAEQEKQHNG